MSVSTVPRNVEGTWGGNDEFDVANWDWIPRGVFSTRCKRRV